MWMNFCPTISCPFSCVSVNSSSLLPILSRTFLKNDIFLVILWLSFSATTFDPLIHVTVYGVIVKFVENLFCLFCFIF